MNISLPFHLKVSFVEEPLKFKKEINFLQLKSFHKIQIISVMADSLTTFFIVFTAISYIQYGSTNPIGIAYASTSKVEPHTLRIL